MVAKKWNWDDGGPLTAGCFRATGESTKGIMGRGSESELGMDQVWLELIASCHMSEAAAVAATLTSLLPSNWWMVLFLIWPPWAAKARLVLIYANSHYAITPFKNVPPPPPTTTPVCFFHHPADFNASWPQVWFEGPSGAPPLARWEEKWTLSLSQFIENANV